LKTNKEVIYYLKKMIDKRWFREPQPS